MRVNLRLLGDVHGHYRRYLDLISKADYSIQLGDFGFDYKCLENVDPANHKIIPGNHDNYDRLPPHALLSYGKVHLGGYDMFYIRGAYSIDKQYRTPGVSWWAAEELTTKQGEECIEAFAEAKPDFVLSHDCPISIYPMIINNPWYVNESWTAKVLEECLQRHQPRRWTYAHHHRKWSEKVGSTRFHCLGELDIMDFGSYNE